MTVSVFLMFVLSVVQTGLEAQEPTHMPLTKDPQLPKDVAAELKNSVEDKECEELLRGFATNMIRAQLSGLGLASQEISPCVSCYADGFLSWNIIPDGVRVAKYGAEGLLMQTVGELAEVIFKCTQCHITDINNIVQTGEMVLTWTSGTLTFTVGRNSERNTSTLDFFMPTADNINPNSVKVECKGGQAFEDICYKTHENGEVERVFRNKAEEVFVDEYGNGVSVKSIDENNFVYSILEPAWACKRPA